LQRPTISSVIAAPVRYVRRGRSSETQISRVSSRKTP
jgi:hypothetical protein